MQSASTGEDHGFTRIYCDLFVAFLVEVGEFAVHCGMDILDSELEMFPEIRHRVFKVEHHSRRAGVEHFHNQLAIICRSGHLITLILTPLWKRNAPASGCSFRSRQVIGQLAFVRVRQHALTFCDQFTLTRREPLMQRKKKIEKSGGNISLKVECCGSGVDGESVESFHAG